VLTVHSRQNICWRSPWPWVTWACPNVAECAAVQTYTTWAILVESSGCYHTLSPCVVKAWFIRKDREDFQASHESERGQDGVVDETAVNRIMLKLIDLLLGFLIAGGRGSAENESSHGCVHIF
jgi:hypothetical protein